MFTALIYQLYFSQPGNPKSDNLLTINTAKVTYTLLEVIRKRYRLKRDPVYKVKAPSSCTCIVHCFRYLDIASRFCHLYTPCRYKFV